MNFSIKKRIHWSFFLLASIFVINGIITIVTLNKNRRASAHISEVINPSLEAMSDFNTMMTESKMYSTNWVMLRSKKEDKLALVKLHLYQYPSLKIKLNGLTSNWHNQGVADSLNAICLNFEQLLVVEKRIMKMLQTFDDYDEPMKKFGATELVEREVLPRTLTLSNSLKKVIAMELAGRTKEERNLQSASAQLRMFIISLSILIVCMGVFLSFYMTKKIIVPINKIKEIINDLGKGIIKRINEVEPRIKIQESSISRTRFALYSRFLNSRFYSQDEIGEMVHSVNHLSDKLSGAASFAKKVGERDFEAHFEPLSEFDTLGKAIIAMRDNLKKSEQELLTRNAHLKKSNMELDQFVYSVSHDLRAPLSSMLGVVDMSEEDLNEEISNFAAINKAIDNNTGIQNGDVVRSGIQASGRMLEHLQLLKASIKKLDSFIQDILDYSRNSRVEIKKEQINFKELLEDISSNLKYMGGVNRRVDIKINIGNDRSYYSDKTRLGVVLNNLISNAIRYQNPEIEDPLVDVCIDTSDTETNIVVKDNGIGISKELHQKIFDMFYRVSNNSAGSGLGLYIVKETVEKLNGRIELSSELGSGSTFTIHLPNS